MTSKRGRISRDENFFSDSAITKEDKIEEILRRGDELRRGPGDLTQFFDNYPKFLEAPERVFQKEKKVISKKMLLNINLQNYLFLLMHTKGSETQIINAIFELGSAVLQEFAQHTMNYTGEKVIRTEDISEISARACAAIRQLKIDKI